MRIVKLQEEIWVEGEGRHGCESRAGHTEDGERGGVLNLPLIEYLSWKKE